MNAGVTHVPRILQRNGLYQVVDIVLEFYRSPILIVILGLCVLKSHLKGLIVIECFAAYKFPTLWLHLLSTRVKTYNQANYQTSKKGQSFD